jgi:DNA helicase INO80
VTEKPQAEPPKGIFTPNGLSKPAPELASVAARAPQRKPFPPGVDAEQVNRAMVDIDNGEKSDVEGPGFEEDLQLYIEKGRKRLMESYRAEQVSRKVSPRPPFLLNVLQAN